MRVVFAGTPQFAVASLQACCDAAVDVVAVYTQPDRPAGRGRKLTPSPVKQAALQRSIAIAQPLTLRDAGAQERLRSYAPDLLVVVAYGLILPRAALAAPTLDCWNVHASLLPRWRGAAPIQRAILAGDHATGVGLMRMQKGLDTGPLLLEKRTPISADDTSGTLHDRLAILGAELLGEGLRKLVEGETFSAIEQAADGVIYAHKIEKAEALLDWNESAAQLARKVRAFDPWPIAEAEIAGERLRIFSATEAVAASDQAPGTLI
ncbi:MAG: methionyl-tRNA formyltransferase, partial [Dokdonella sp.]